jgi:hypothetical protein
MSAYLQCTRVARQELESAGASVNTLEIEGAQVLAWIERWQGRTPEMTLGAEAQAQWAPVDATVSFADGMLSGQSARMQLSLLLADTMPDLEGEPHWVAFAQTLSSKFAPVVIEIEKQSNRLNLSYAQLLYAGTSPQVPLYCEKLATVAAVALPAIARLRLQAWTVQDARNLAQQVLNEALTLGYQQ